MIQCYGRVNGHRYLVGDTTGKLFMLYLQCEEMSELPEQIVTDLKLQLLGEVLIVGWYNILVVQFTIY